ncbi:hypothetical protein OAO87_00125 [bacterium]|nr:hypothetical protein [bacterium]
MTAMIDAATRIQRVHRRRIAPACTKYTAKAHSQMHKGKMNTYTYHALRKTGLFGHVSKLRDHVAYKVLAFKERSVSNAHIAYAYALRKLHKSEKVRGFRTTNRGDNIAKRGLMTMAGVHGTGEGWNHGATLPHRWGETKAPENTMLEMLMLDHVCAFEKILMETLPGYVRYLQETVANANGTPFTLTPLGITTSVAISTSYVAGAHCDGRERIWSAILFVCVQSVSHWTFHAGNHTYELPTTPGMGRLIILKSREIEHGTCYTSAGTEDHLNMGTVICFDQLMKTALEHWKTGVSTSDIPITQKGGEIAEDALRYCASMRESARELGW